MALLRDSVLKIRDNMELDSPANVTEEFDIKWSFPSVVMRELLCDKIAAEEM
jgi:hypothetical protein